MGAPSINILFTEAGTSAITRGERGVVALLLKDTPPKTNPLTITRISEIPTDLSAENKAQISLAFKGYEKSPKSVIIYVVTKEETDFTAAQKVFETIKWDYLAFPEIPDEEVEKFATWIKGLRDNIGKRVKAVLPKSASDHEGIINYCNESNYDGTKTYTAKEYCARIAGLLAGTPLTISATYAVLPELKDCDRMTKSELDTAVDAGKLVLVNDGEKVKIVRAVNSLTTTSDSKGKSFKKIKIVDIMDQIYTDVTKTVSDNYIGKVPNDYDHKVLLISAISAYFDELEISGLLQKGGSSVYIDMQAQTTYLKSQGVNVDQLSEQDIKEYNTDDKVFLGATITILDTMEDIDLSIQI